MRRKSMVRARRCIIVGSGGGEWLNASGPSEARASLRRLWLAWPLMLNRGLGNALRTWASRIAKRRGRKRAMVALARRMAVVMHRMWVDGTTFRMEAEPTT